MDLTAMKLHYITKGCFSEDRKLVLLDSYLMITKKPCTKNA